PLSQPQTGSDPESTNPDRPPTPEPVLIPSTLDRRARMRTTRTGDSPTRGASRPDQGTRRQARDLTAGTTIAVPASRPGRRTVDSEPVGRLARGPCQRGPAKESLVARPRQELREASFFAIADLRFAAWFL